MNQLAEIQIENKENLGLVVSSRVVAEEIGKRHTHVLEQLDRISESQDVGSLILPNQYKVKGQNRNYKEYLLTKDGFTLYMFNIQGHNDFKMNYINKFNEMENALVSKTPALMSRRELLQMALEQEEENEKLRLETEIGRQRINEMKPKASYYDNILQNKSLVTIGQISKDYGMSAQALNKLLHDLKVQYKQSGQWLLYSKHQSKRLTHSDTTEIEHKDGSKSVRMHTKWTQNGRLFLYELLKQNDILPMIEQEAS